VRSILFPTEFVVLVGYSLKKLLRDFVSSNAPLGVIEAIESLSLGLVGSYIEESGSISYAAAYLYFV
jgi:hypothetical protein